MILHLVARVPYVAGVTIDYIHALYRKAPNMTRQILALYKS